MIGKAIYHILTNDANVSAIVGSRIFPVIAKIDGDKPSIIYHAISTTPTDFKQGPSDIDFIRVQLNIYAPSYDTTLDIADKVRLALDRYPHTTVAGVHLAGVSFLDQGDGWDDQAKVNHINQDFQFRIKRDL